MISFLRTLIHSKIGGVVALLFLILVAFAFALGDISGSGSFGGLGGGNVAKVGGDKIGSAELAEAVQNAHRTARQESPLLDLATFVRAGGFDDVLDRTINSHVVEMFGKEAGLAVSDRMVDAEIRNLPGTQGLEGKFDEKAFRRMLADANVSEMALRDSIRRSLYAEQLLSLSGFGHAVSQSYALPYANMILEKRAGQVAILPAAAFIPEKAPTPAMMADFYRKNAARFTIPEQRAVSYAMFDGSALGQAGEPTEAEIAAYYKANAAQYAAEEMRELSQLIVPTEAAAKAIAAKVAGGQALADAGRAVGLSVNRTGAVSRAAYASASNAAVAGAAFAAAQGALVPVTKGDLGWYVVRVDKVTRRPARALAEVRGEIATRLGTEKRQKAIFDMTSAIEEELDKGSSLSDLAKTYKLKVETTPLLLATGKSVRDPAYKPIPEMAAILPAAFELSTDGEGQLVELVRGQRFAIVSVAESVEAAPPPLKAIGDLVMREWALEQGAVQAEKYAAEVRRKVAAGQSLEQALAATGRRLPPPSRLSGSRAELTRNGPNVPPPLAMMFTMAKGTVKTLKAPQNRGWFVVKLDEVVEGNASGNAQLLAAARAQFARSIGNEYSQQFVSAMARQVGVEKNKAALADLRKQMTGKDGGAN